MDREASCRFNFSFLQMKSMYDLISHLHNAQMKQWQEKDYTYYLLLHYHIDLCFMLICEMNI